ncbi:hypothetical protein D3C71_1235160 [compost metagenome]
MEERARKNSKDSKRGSASAYDHQEVIYFNEEEWEEIVEYKDDDESEYDEE